MTSQEERLLSHCGGRVKSAFLITLLNYQTSLETGFLLSKQQISVWSWLVVFVVEKENPPVSGRNHPLVTRGAVSREGGQKHVRMWCGKQVGEVIRIGSVSQESLEAALNVLLTVLNRSGTDSIKNQCRARPL